MAYDRQIIFQQAQAAIREHNLFYIEDVVAFLPVSKHTFYRFFQIECDEYDAIKKMLEANKVRTKAFIRNKLYEDKGGV